MSDPNRQGSTAGWGWMCSSLRYISCKPEIMRENKGKECNGKMGVLKILALPSKKRGGGGGGGGGGGCPD